jgi:squalene synthase HpnC
VTHASAISDLNALRIDPAGAPPTAGEARRQVRALAESHYENFSVLSRFVPPDVRDDFAAVYAYCRWSDDLADETGSDAAARERSLDLLARWRSQLIGCFAFARGESADPPRHAVFMALAEAIRRHDLADAPFHHLLDAFEQDQRVTRYETWDQVIHYCTRSADPVGRIVLMLAGRRLDDPASADLFRMSDATCTALQLTNFWQDVRRDLLDRDRVYIPSRDTGVTAERLCDWATRSEDPAARIPFIRALRPLVERTRALFELGRPLPAALASPLSPVIWLFGAGGESVLRSVERIGCATLWTRPRLTASRKLSLLMIASARKHLGLFPREGASPA